MKDAALTETAIVDALAKAVMGWGVAPDRFLIGRRCWRPRWRFAPLERLEDAFLVLLRAKPDNYTMGTDDEGRFAVQVSVQGRVGRAVGEPPARTIALAVARALGIEVEA